MNRNIEKTIVLILSIIFIVFMITSNKDVVNSVLFSFSIWKDNLFPTLFPFFVISSILIQYGCVDIIGLIFNYPVKKLFKLPASCCFVFTISLLSGFPSGAKYTVELLKNNFITLEQANRLITFTHYSNPLFILGFISLLLNRKISYIILFSHVTGGIITGIIFNFKYKYTSNNKYIKNTTSIPFGTCLHKSIMDSLNTMFFLLGIITFFLIFTELINKIFDLPTLIECILSGILEMTQGIKKISELNISYYFKVIFTTLFISFGGLSVHMQVIGIISDTKIKYKHFLVARIIHSMLSIILVSVLFFIN